MARVRYRSSGAGSGGAVILDPASLVNDGTIDVADGNGATAYGGLVDTFGEPFTGTGQVIVKVFPPRRFPNPRPGF